jgi:hypothetical protein
MKLINSDITFVAVLYVVTSTLFGLNTEDHMFSDKCPRKNKTKQNIITLVPGSFNNNYITFRNVEILKIK